MDSKGSDTYAVREQMILDALRRAIALAERNPDGPSSAQRARIIALQRKLRAFRKGKL